MSGCLEPGESSGWRKKIKNPRAGPNTRSKPNTCDTCDDSERPQQPQQPQQPARRLGGAQVRRNWRRRFTHRIVIGASGVARRRWCRGRTSERGAAYSRYTPTCPRPRPPLPPQWPDQLPASVTVHSAVSLLDVTSTFLDAANVSVRQVGAGCVGRSV